MPEASQPNEDSTYPPIFPGTLQLAQIGLRLLGIMFLVDGVSGMIGQITYDATFYSNANYGAASFRNGFYLYIGPGVYMLAGLYFVIDGRWVLRNIFASSNKPRDIDED
ncbi:MAG: hypothetical protein ACE361_15950 [Aureliella sp.]